MSGEQGLPFSMKPVQETLEVDSVSALDVTLGADVLSSATPDVDGLSTRLCLSDIHAST